MAGLIKLIEADKDICIAKYEKWAYDGKNPPFKTGLSYAFDVDVLGRDTKQYSMTETGLKKVSWAGAGCMLVKSKVFSTMEPLWFYFPKIRRKLENGDTDLEMFSEDKNFCLNAGRQGFETWVDFDVYCEHEGLKNFKPNWDW
jgi:hypothetical protein